MSINLTTTQPIYVVQPVSYVPVHGPSMSSSRMMPESYAYNAYQSHTPGQQQQQRALRGGESFLSNDPYQTHPYQNRPHLSTTSIAPSHSRNASLQHISTESRAAAFIPSMPGSGTRSANTRSAQGGGSSVSASWVQYPQSGHSQWAPSQGSQAGTNAFLGTRNHARGVDSERDEGREEEEEGQGSGLRRFFGFCC